VQVLTERFIARDFLQDFDLSRNKSLRTLQTTTWSLDDALRARPPVPGTSLLTYALSTITSPVFSEIVVFYRDYDLPGAYSAWPGRSPVQSAFQNGIGAGIAEEASRHHRRFGVFRALRKVRDFRLVLCADACDGGYGYERTLKNAIAAEKAERGFDSIFPEPLVTSILRGARYHVREGFWADHPFHWI